MVATKINNKATIQAAASFTHFNGVDSLYANDAIAVNLKGRYKVTTQLAIIAGYDIPFVNHEKIETQPNISFGLEIGTSGHAFQIFAGNFRSIVPQYNSSFNENNKFLIGFNMTRLWNF